MLVSIAGMVVIVDEDLIQTQTAECLTIYSTCENKLLYMYSVQHDFITSTVLYVRRGWEWVWKRKGMMEKCERGEGDDEKEWKRERRGWERKRE